MNNVQFLIEMMETILESKMSDETKIEALNVFIASAKTAFGEK